MPDNFVDLPAGTYVVMEEWGICRVCGKYQDLRCGACFDCCSLVKGERIPGVGHKLWQADKPQNSWIVRDENA